MVQIDKIITTKIEYTASHHYFSIGEDLLNKLLTAKKSKAKLFAKIYTALKPVMLDSEILPAPEIRLSDAKEIFREIAGEDAPYYIQGSLLKYTEAAQS